MESQAGNNNTYVIDKVLLWTSMVTGFLAGIYYTNLPAKEFGGVILILLFFKLLISTSVRGPQLRSMLTTLAILTFVAILSPFVFTQNIAGAEFLQAFSHCVG